MHAEAVRRFNAAREAELPAVLEALKDPVWLIRMRAAAVDIVAGKRVIAGSADEVVGRQGEREGLTGRSIITATATATATRTCRRVVDEDGCSAPADGERHDFRTLGRGIGRQGQRNDGPALSVHDSRSG